MLLQAVSIVHAQEAERCKAPGAPLARIQVKQAQQTLLGLDALVKEHFPYYDGIHELTYQEPRTVRTAWIQTKQKARVLQKQLKAIRLETILALKTLTSYVLRTLNFGGCIR